MHGMHLSRLNHKFLGEENSFQTLDKRFSQALIRLCIFAIPAQELFSLTEMSMLTAKCWPLLWLLCRYASAVVADVSCEEHDLHATQLLQMTSIIHPELHSSLKPWDVHYYLGGRSAKKGFQ